MAWTAPRTWVAGALVVADDLNEQLRDNMLILKTPFDANGKVVALDSSRVADLSGLNLTGVAKSGAATDWTRRQAELQRGLDDSIGAARRSRQVVDLG